jgi:iron complex outermembrane recepter protein
MAKKILGLLSGAALCAVAAALPVGPAFAQDAPAAEADDGRVDEIVVTAQRREQNLQDVPLSMAAFNAETLTEIGAHNIEAINGKVPNVVVEHVGLFPAAASLSMRGIGYAGIESYADPDVAVYINGVYQSRNSVALSSTVDVRSLEVLRGPQGTLYGRNAYAGVIALTTNRANLEDVEGSAAVTLGNYGRAEAEFVGNLPLIEGVLAARLAVRSHQFDGFFENNGIVLNPDPLAPPASTLVDQTLKGQSIGMEDTLYVRPSLRFQPAENLTIDLIGEWYRERSEAYPAINGPLSPSAIATAGFPGQNPFGDASKGLASDGSDPFQIGSNLGDRPANYDSETLTADIAYDTGNGTLRGILSYTDVVSEVWADTDGTNINMFSSVRYEDYDAFSAELQYVADLTDRLNLVSGFTYMDDHYQTTQLSFTDFAAPFPAVFTPFTPQNPVSGAGPTYINNTGKREAWAAYAQAEYSLTDPLSIVVGARYSWERKYGYMGENSTLTAAGFLPTMDFSQHQFTTNPAVLFRAPEQTWSNLSPRLGVNYEPTDDVLLYAFWQRAFKSGGFNANAADRAAFETPYDQQSVDSYEAGFKSEWLDNRLRLNVNVFLADYADLQRSAVTPSSSAPSGVVTVTTNAANVQSYGIELEAAMRVTPDFSVFANVGWNPSKYQDYCADLNGAGTSNVPAPGEVGCGTVLGPSPTLLYIVPTDNTYLNTLRAPTWDIAAGAEYELDLGESGSLAINGSVNYRSETWTQLLNLRGSYREPMTVFDGNMVWTPAGDRFSITLWGRNLTDEVELLNWTPVAAAFAFAHPTPPRTYGLTIRADF